MKELLTNPRTNAILTGLFIFLMIIGSSLKGNSIPKSYIFTLDKLLHIIEYYIFGTLLFFIFYSSSKTPDVISLILGTFYSLIDELYQSTVIGRDSSALDVLADIIGLILSILFIKLFLNSFVHDR
jgi:VanZ family protein